MKDQLTIYCRRRHRIADGVPIAHSCRVLDPAFLEAERNDALGEAADVLDRMPVVLHPGVPVSE
jgi:hypothetical protein